MIYSVIGIRKKYCQQFQRKVFKALYLKGTEAQRIIQWKNDMTDCNIVVISYASLDATYVASFTLAHVFLKASDAGLETADSVLKWTSNEKVLRPALGFVIFFIWCSILVEKQLVPKLKSFGVLQATNIIVVAVVCKI